MKKKRPVDRQPIKRFPATKAATSLNTMPSFNKLYQRYLDAVYRSVGVTIAHSRDATSHALREQIIATFEELASRINH